MDTANEEFLKRVSEIRDYVDFIHKIDEEKYLIIAGESGMLAYTRTVREDLLRTSKASALLMLYNLMESSVTNAVEAIFDELERESVSFDICRDEVRLVVLGNVNRHKPSKLLADLNSLAVDIVVKSFRKAETVSGNVDAREIGRVAKKFGFQKPRKQGERLLSVKTQRNDLAHGSKSFTEVGRTFTMTDILEITDEVVAYLTELMANVAQYLSSKSYLSQGIR
jgi:hypothetical protein